MTTDDALAVAARFAVASDGASAVRLDGGYSNETFRIDTPRARFVVRRYGRLHVTRRAILFEHAIVAHAAAAMREVVAPLRDARGRTLIAAPGGLAAVLPYIEGSTGRRDAATARAAAGVLARFHRAMRDVHVAGGMRSTRMLGTLPWLRERFARFGADPLTGRVLDWSALVVAVSGATVRVAANAPSLPHVVVHGDPNPGNVVTDDAGDVRGLIDFDFAHETERVYDVGTLADEFARDGEDAPLVLDRVAAIVEAYAQAAPLSATERAAVADAMLCRAATLVWYVATRHGERVPGDVGGAPRYAARALEIERLAPRLREAAGA